MDPDHHLRSGGVEANVFVGVADVANHFAGDLLYIDVSLGSDLSGNATEISGYQSFTGHTAATVASEVGIQHGVGDLITDLVGVAFGNGFGSEQEVF